MDFSNLHENRAGLILIGKRRDGQTLIDGQRDIESTNVPSGFELTLHWNFTPDSLWFRSEI